MNTGKLATCIIMISFIIRTHFFVCKSAIMIMMTTIRHFALTDDILQHLSHCSKWLTPGNYGDSLVIISTGSLGQPIITVIIRHFAITYNYCTWYRWDNHVCSFCCYISARRLWFRARCFHSAGVVMRSAGWRSCLGTGELLIFEAWRGSSQLLVLPAAHGVIIFCNGEASGVTYYKTLHLGCTKHL